MDLRIGWSKKIIVIEDQRIGWSEMALQIGDPRIRGSREAQGESEHQNGRREKRRPQEKRNLLKRSPPSSLQNDRSAKSRLQERPNWKKRTAPPSQQSGPQTKRGPRVGHSKKGFKSRGESSTTESRKNPEEETRKTTLYPLRRRAGASKRQEESRRTSHYSLRSQEGSRKRQGEEAAATSREKTTLCRRVDYRKSGFVSTAEKNFMMEQFARHARASRSSAATQQEVFKENARLHCFLDFLTSSQAIFAENKSDFIIFFGAKVGHQDGWIFFH
ncbi:hypothetical protein TNCV_3221081 [Trichonephila clavipes]|nr:hypothetical protein TNCV_3221081 [Trichonephila clavipes]